MRKVGLALGGGGARGLAHIGVLEALEKGKIPIDMISGTSAGAVIGALYAQGKSTNELKELAIHWDWKKRAQLIDLALPKTGFIAGKKIKETLRSIMGDVRFSELKLPLACVATDIMSGQEVVINEGPVLEGVRASFSVPVIFTLAKWKGSYLADGGLVKPVPVSVLKDMGAGFIIAVNVMPRLGKRPKQEESAGVKEPNIFSIMIKIIDITTSHLVETSLKGADVVIEPSMPGIGFGDFHRVRECILQGELAAADSIAKIKRLLVA